MEKSSTNSEKNSKTNLSSSFGLTLSELIKKSKFGTQKELAEHLGMSQQQISNYTKGNSLPSVETLCKIADFYNVSVGYLLGKDDSPNPDIDDREIHNRLGLSNETIVFMRSEIKRICQLANTNSVDEALEKQRQAQAFVSGKKTTQKERIAFAKKLGLAEKSYLIVEDKTYILNEEDVLFSLSRTPACLVINTLIDDMRFYVPIVGKRHPHCILEALWQIFEHEKIRPNQFYFLSKGSEQELADTNTIHGTILVDGKGDWKMDSRVMYNFFLLDLQRALNEHGLKMQAQYLMEKKKK